jgi:hypothetical protein
MTKARISLIETLEITSLEVEVFEVSGLRGSPGRCGWCVGHGSGREALDLVGELGHVGAAQFGLNDFLDPLSSTLESHDRISAVGQEPRLNLSRRDGSISGDLGCEM